MSLGVWEILLLAAIVGLFFGSGKLPGLASEFSRGIKRFRDDLTRPAAGADAQADALEKPVAALPRPDQAARS